MKFSSLKSRFSLGYTFVEALVVIAVFSGFVVSTSGVFVMAYRAQAGSYHAELEEQSNMRGALELEHLFRASLGYEPLNETGTPDPTLEEFNQVRMDVPNWETGVMEFWVFQFLPDGTDLEGRVSGAIRIKTPDMGASDFYEYSSNVSLPVGRSTLFVLDDMGRLDYHWIVRSTDSDLSWRGILVTSQ